MERSRRPDRLFLLIFVFVVAPIGAVVVISVLMIFGVPPPIVFTPGRVLVATLSRAGIHAPRFLGVLATAASYWAVIAALGLTWDRLRTRAAAA